jgi:hypothetical protein
MPQDRESGLRASRWGKDCARRIAAAIGAEMLGTKSNECAWGGERTIIKCAHPNTNSVGVLYHMTNRIDGVLGAFQGKDGSYRVVRLPMERCRAIMDSKPTRSRGPSAGRVGLIPRKVFEDEDRLIAVVQIEELSD